MPGNRKQQALSAAMVRTVNRPGMYADGNGLNLKVVSSGAKRWVQRVTIGGKRHNLGLGGYPAVSLAEARELAAENQRAIRQGRDPLAEKHQAEEDLRRPPVPAFTQAAEQVIEMRRPTWSNTKHASQWENTLRTYAHPVIGRKPVDEITTADVLAVLTPIWTVKPETASRVRQRLETVLDWTVAQGWRADNPAGKAILRVLPRISRLKGHHTALPYGDVPDALRQVRESTADPVTRLSFEFLVLTAARSGEVRLAMWEEMEVESSTWKVPAARMKARREHRGPADWTRPGNPVPGPGVGRAGQRPGISGRKPKASVRHGIHGLAAAIGNTRGTPRVPQQLQGLVHGGPRWRSQVVPERGGAGPQPGQCDGNRLRPNGPLGATTAVDG
jgi:hypothetical protein